MNTAPTVCLLGVSFDASNMGMNALAMGTLKAFITRYPNGQLFVLEYGKEPSTFKVQMEEKVVSVPLVNIRFSKKLYLRNHIAFLLALALLARLIPFPWLREKLIANNFCLRRMADADFVASMAGGDSFSDIYGLPRLLYVSLPQVLALVLGKKLIILPQTVGPFQSTCAKIIARAILRRAALIYSRDHEGPAEIRNLIGAGTVDHRVRFCYDVGFVLDPIKPLRTGILFDDQQETKRPVVGLNISGLLYMGGYSRNNMFDLKLDYKALISDLINSLITTKGATVLLIPHVFGTDGESDVTACHEVYSAFKESYGKRLLIADGHYDQCEIKYIIGQCNFFIGSRMHACIAALSQNVPTVSIAYSRKFIGVMQTIDIPDLVADPRYLGKAHIVKLIEDLFEQKMRIQRHLEKTIPHVKETILNLFDDIDSNAMGV